MNVAFEDWIPVVTTGGERRLASLCQVLAEGDQFADLAVRPHERVALMRLLLCVAHAALDGPKDYDAWCEVPARLPEAVPDYLEQWRDSFELFHPEKPWLQVAGLDVIPSDKKKAGGDESDWTSIRRLSFTRASGSNTTLHDHGATGERRQASPSELALDLLAFQNYFVAGGQASARMWGGRALSKPPNPKGGPCSGKSIVFTYLRARDLRNSIYLNMNSHESLGLHFGTESDWLGKPLWELPIESPESEEAIFNATRTYLGRLVPQTRLLRLSEDCKSVLLGGGFTYPKYQDEKNPFHPDTHATLVIKGDSERELLCASPDKAIWRELSAIVVRCRASSPNRGPLCLGNVPEESPCDLIVCAMITNPKQAAEIVDLVDSVFHIPAELTTPEGIALYQNEVKTAEGIAGRLTRAVEEYRAAVDGGWEGRLKSAGAKKRELKAKLHATASTYYWTAVEKNVPMLMAHIESLGTDAVESTGDAWRRMLFRCACDAYRTACGQETPRQIRAFAEGWRRLVKRKNEPASKREEKKP